MTNPPAADQTCFGHLVLEFEICLYFGAWSLGFHKLALLQHSIALLFIHSSDPESPAITDEEVALKQTGFDWRRRYQIHS